MALVKVKPTSPGRRQVVKVVNPDLHKGKPYAPLLEKQSKKAGRNNNGHITMRHQGGGHKQHYRMVDFRRDKDGIPAKVERIEYDPNRTANLALLCYADGERRYIIAPKGLTVGSQLASGIEAPIKAGNTLPLRNIPVGTTIHCIELQPGKGAQLARSAGTSVQLLAREGSYAQVRLRSGEIRKVHVDCRATIGEVGNEEHALRTIGKAGAVRWRGVRPTVRGVAMNPIDHPHGGGEGKTAAAQDPVSPWGTLAKGYKTRKNKRTRGMIVQFRHKKRTA
jgi:large subunit ribosomal protein L2